jgi:sodium ion-translocating decarboxylase beta subunit
MDGFSLGNITGILHLTYGNIIMIAIGLTFIFLAIRRRMEPYELLPIGIGIILANLPLTRLMGLPSEQIQGAGILGVFYYYGIYFWNILPPLVFVGLGAMFDFGPLLANPRLIIFGMAAQIGIFIALFGALGLGFPLEQACSIGIIGGADGPTTIFTTAILSPQLLGLTAVAAYSYMALVAIIQPPIAKLLTTKEERKIVMKETREVSQMEKLLFPLVMMIGIIVLVPMAAPLIGMLMLGNLLRESGVVPRLSNAVQNELLNIVTLFLMLVIGASFSADVVLHVETLYIFGLGLLAFATGSASGILLAKLYNLVFKDKVNPLIGSAGVSAVPMAARVSHRLAQEADPHNFLLPHALGPNVAGVIGSAVVAGVFLGGLAG